MTDTQNVNCIACGNEIPVDAHLCSRCHSYQTAWKNHIRYFSTIIGLIAAIIAALTYVVPPLWKEMTWLDKIQLLSLRAPGAISVANVGDGDLFMLTFKWSGEIEGNESLEVFQINRKLAVAQLIEAVPLERKDLNKVKLARYLTIDEVPKGSRAGVVNKALSIEDKCYDLRIFTKEHMEMMIRQSKSLWVVPLNGSLSFYSIHSRKTLEEKFTVFGFVMKGNDSKCSP